MSAPASASPAATTRRTALALVVPEAQPLVRAFRARHHGAAIARGVPPHVCWDGVWRAVETFPLDGA